MSSERLLVSSTLRIGVVVSFTLLAAGIGASAVNAPSALIVPLAPGLVLEGLFRMEATSLIHAGLIVLMLTPFARVAVLVAHFVRRREAAFALGTIGVLCLLIAAVVVGLT